MEFTGSALVSVLVVPTVQWLKGHVKLFEEVPLATYLLMGVLVYGVTVLYTGKTTGAWVFAGADLFNTVLDNAWIAVTGKVALKTYQRMAKK